MNTITLIVTILVLWLVMGLGFLAAYAKNKKTGQAGMAIWFSTEGLLFIATILFSIIYLFYHIANH